MPQSIPSFRAQPKTGHNSTPKLILRSLMAEMLGTCFLVYLGCGKGPTTPTLPLQTSPTKNLKASASKFFGFFPGLEGKGLLPATRVGWTTRRSDTMVS